MAKRKKTEYIIKPPLNVTGTPECDYVLKLPWKWRGHAWTIRSVPKYTVDQLRPIFRAWGIGWDADLQECRPGLINVNVNDQQFQRVGIKIPQQTDCPLKYLQILNENVEELLA